MDIINPYLQERYIPRLTGDSDMKVSYMTQDLYVENRDIEILVGFQPNKVTYNMLIIKQYSDGDFGARLYLKGMAAEFEDMKLKRMSTIRRGKSQSKCFFLKPKFQKVALKAIL